MSLFLRVAALMAVVVVCHGSTSFFNQVDADEEILSAITVEDAVPTAASLKSTLQLSHLSARALPVWVERPDIKRKQQVLVLNVTWALPNDTDNRNSVFHVSVHSTAPPEDAYCWQSQSADKFAIPKDNSSCLIPDPDSMEPHVRGEFKVRAGCSYNVTLYKRLPQELGSTINYTVPDCVDAICSCKRFLEPSLPKPAVTQAKRMNASALLVRWTYPSTEGSDVDVNITHFSVALLGITSQNIAYRLQTILEVPFAPGKDRSATTYTRVVPLSIVLQPDLSYRIEVTVEDKRRGCHGLSGGIALEVSLEKKMEPTGGSGIWLTVLSSVTFVLACTLACTMAWQRCGSWLRRKCIDRNVQPVQWQGIYKAVAPELSRPRPNFPAMQHSLIYVEKEIEEAKARGEADTLEVGYGRLELGREIGKGAFGRVFLARAECIAGRPGFTNVAVKKLKHKAKNDEVEEFLSEIAMLKQVGRHPNIVTLLGCVTIRQPYCMIMEYIPCGDLLQYLRRLRVEYERRTGSSLPFIATRSRPTPRSPRYVDLALSSDSEASYITPDGRRGGARPSVTETEWSLLSAETSAPLTPAHHCGDDRSQHLEYILDPKELQNFAVQIARGMEHLEKKQITHRDLAARNVLIDENKTLKISDFGLSRSGIYVNTKRKKVPLRWLSVEAMRDNLYSSKSDVWAFAIVLWEIGTLGGFPYPTINDYDLLTYLLDGKRLDKPDNCTDELYSLMLVCWSHAADSRPTFGDLVSHLDSVICRRRVYVDFDNLRPDYTFPPTEQLKTTPSDETSTPGDDREAASASE